MMLRPCQHLLCLPLLPHLVLTCRCLSSLNSVPLAFGTCCTSSHLYFWWWITPFECNVRTTQMRSPFVLDDPLRGSLPLPVFVFLVPRHHMSRANRFSIGTKVDLPYRSDCRCCTLVWSRWPVKRRDEQYNILSDLPQFPPPDSRT